MGLFSDLKDRYDMRDVVQRILGEPPASADSTGVFFSCPFHPDGSTPNLHILPRYGKCFSGECNYAGDMFDFIERYWTEILGQPYSLSAAVAWLAKNINGSQVPVASPGRGRTEYIVRPNNDFTFVNACHHRLVNNSSLVDYWFGRGLTWETIEHFRLGYYVDWHRFVTPYLNHVGSYGTKLRRHDQWAKDDMENKGRSWIDAQKDAIWKRRLQQAAKYDSVPVVPTDADVWKSQYPKYLWRKTDKPWLFNEEILQGGQWLPYILLTADEASAMTLWQEGYYATCWPSDSQFPGPDDIIHYWRWDRNKIVDLTISDVFRRVLQIIIVRDNDESGKRAGRKRMEILGPHRCELVSMPHGKDPNDFYVAGGRFEALWPGLPKRSDI